MPVFRLKDKTEKILNDAVKHVLTTDGPFLMDIVDADLGIDEKVNILSQYVLKKKGGP